MCLQVGMSMFVQFPRRPKALNPLKLDTQKVVNHLTWMLKNEVGFFGRVASSLNH